MTISKPIKIAFFTGSFKYGGTEHYLVQLLQKIDRNRFDPVVMCFYKSGAFLLEVQRLNVSIHVFPLENALFNLTGIKAVWRASAFLRRNNVQILHTLGDWANFFGIIVGKLAGVPNILAGQKNMGHWMVKNKYRLVSRLIYKYLADGVVVNAHAIKKLLVEDFKIKRDQVQVIHDGISVVSVNTTKQEIKNRNNKVIIGFVGRLHHVKGVDLLIEAAKMLKKEYPEILFLIVGDGPVAPELKTQVERYGLREYFQFTGHQKDLYSYINAMDLLILPSRSEGFPIVLLEAMACGKPVIATRVGGVPELVRVGETGLIIDANDIHAIAQAIKKLCSDCVLRKRMGMEGLNRVKEHFGLEKMIRKHHDYYLEKMDLDSSNIVGKHD